MIEVGLWVQISEQETYLVKKDVNGYPDLIPLPTILPIKDRALKKEKIKEIYEKLTKKDYVHSHATTRQMLWDLIEAAIHLLP